MTNNQKIAEELNISIKQVEATIELLDGGATIPFISRYRKERTGSLDEVIITNIRDRIAQLRELEKRKESILKSIDDQQKLTPELKKKIINASTMAILEDIYLPYKPKRRTKATVAREKGLEPLAKIIFEQLTNAIPAKEYLSSKHEVNTIDEAIAGARDIIAEWINEDAGARSKMRKLFENEAVISSRVIKNKEEAGQKYRDYFEWTEPIKSIPSHRLLALRRGEKELILSLDITPPEDLAIDLLEKQFLKAKNNCADEVKKAVKDAYKRLMKPSMETELRLNTKHKADEDAINVFSKNLRQLLMAAPLGEKAILAIDPGFRTGCKVVCLSAQGKLLDKATIFPNEPQKRIQEAAASIKQLSTKHKIEAIAIGNGTASRETEKFIRDLNISNTTIVMVNESGASVYSASAVARAEFPNEDVTVRGAVSIGRRLMDPLAELVKIDPKSIGVGQYQHDVDQNALKKSLDDVVLSCVNNVGVELNTASKELLTYVSGLGESIAQNIVKYREENGAFKSREDLKNVARLGNKVFEQAAGFLRIKNAPNPLDESAVHPERYTLVKKMASDQQSTIKELIADQQKLQKIKPEKYVTNQVGLPTLKDILSELTKPGRDPREKFETFQFKEGVNEISDLTVGMQLPGIVTNITNFGAFVDIGVHQDGLVHISQLANHFIKKPEDVVKVHQKVQVRVVEVDVKRKRIALSMKDENSEKPKVKRKDKKQVKEQSMQEKLKMLQSKFK